MKTYEIKTYSWSGVFKKQINPLNVTTDISFTEELQWGQWNLNLTIVWSLDDFVCSDIVEIREVWDDKDILASYTGIIEEIDVKEFKDSEIISLSILWVFTVLNDALYKSWWNRTFTKTDTPWNIVKSIIDSFNTDYWVLSWDTQNLTTNVVRYTWSSIDITWTTISRSFENINCLAAIKKTLENTWFDFFIGSDWVVIVKQTINQPEVFLTHWREIVYAERRLSKKDMVNKFYLARNGWTTVIYQDWTSITDYKIKEEYKSDTDIQNLATQDVIWNQKIAEFKDERNIISLVLKVQKSDFLYPWYLVTTQNSKREIISKQITKIEKSKNQWKLYFWEFVSFWKTILWG